MGDAKTHAESLVPRFKLDRLLNQDQAGRRTSVLGTIDDKPALLILERAPFPTSEGYFAAAPASLAALKNLGANDIYHWYMGRSGAVPGTPGEAADGDASSFIPDLKINLIYPCTETHIKKYSRQGVRLVRETPAIYRDHVRPYMARKRAEGRLNWAFNIIEGRKEVEDVIFRTELGREGDEGFLLLPDLNWDRTTLDALHLLALVERRDIWSLRDLRRRHVPWLEHMRDRLVAATTQKYPAIEADQLKLYVHYQPTYYHFHIHIVHVQLEAGATQAVGKAVGLDSIIETLRAMGGGDGAGGGHEEEGEAGMHELTLSYTLGEESELWTEVFGPLKANAGGGSAATSAPAPAPTTASDGTASQSQ